MSTLTTEERCAQLFADLQEEAERQPDGKELSADELAWACALVRAGFDESGNNLAAPNRDVLIKLLKGRIRVGSEMIPQAVRSLSDAGVIQYRHGVHGRPAVFTFSQEKYGRAIAPLREQIGDD